MNALDPYNPNVTIEHSPAMKAYIVRVREAVIDEHALSLAAHALTYRGYGDLELIGRVQEAAGTYTFLYRMPPQ